MWLRFVFSELTVAGGESNELEPVPAHPGQSAATTVCKSLVIAQLRRAITGSANSRRLATQVIKHRDFTIRSDIGIWLRSPTPTLSPGKASIACNFYG